MQRNYNFSQSVNSNKDVKASEVNIHVTELVLTPLTCASIINEIIKYLIYQKSQIPYSYNWLKFVMDRKRNSDNQSEINKFAVERHYRTVSTAYDALENITKNLNEEFKNCGNDIQEVMILFGTTIYNPREVFKIKLNGLAFEHLENNHYLTNVKNQHKILRNILFAQEWLSAMESTVPLTNVYVMLQKRIKQYEHSDNFFIPNDQYAVSSMAKNIVINIHQSGEIVKDCCKHVTIFEDQTERKIPEQVPESNEKSEKYDCDLMWFQAKVSLKGFKECFINNVSASELW